jgi:hypothetical protein
MFIPSNLYAEKVFAEHPLGLWALDEKVDYISLISEEDRDLSTWSDGPNYVVQFTTRNPSSEELVGVPFPDSISKVVVPSTGSSRNEKVSLKNPEIDISDFSEDIKTFSVSFYVKVLHSYTTAIEIGYASGTSTTAEEVRSFAPPIPNEWSMYSVIFDLPIGGSVSSIVPFISFSYINQEAAGAPPQEYVYDYIVNGLTVGQESESFNATSLGIDNVVDAQDPNFFRAEAYVPAYQYGLGTNDAKYLISNSKLLAKNTSMPLVYGSSSLTKIIPNPSNNFYTVPDQAFPSMVFPSFNMLDDTGRYNTYTFETWLRVDNRSEVLRKIIGPIFSNNGVYVEGPFIKLRIGDSVGSHFIGEWYRPMLIDVRVGLDYANLLINGEQVIAISFKTNNVDLLDYAMDNRFRDTWGVYAYPDVPVVEIECPAFYSYVVPIAVAKRRFAYGQAVESPDGVNKAFGASTAFVDYSVADYTNNYQYPDMGKWNQGIAENIDTSGNSLSSPIYPLPKFIFQEADYDYWFSIQSIFNIETFFSFKNYMSFNFKGFMRLDKIDVSSTPTKAIYMIVSVDELPDEEQVLIKLVDNLNGNSLTVSLLEDAINYKFKFNGVETTLYTQSMAVEKKTLVGVSFEELTRVFGSNLETFLARSSQLNLTLAGDQSFSKTFEGNIYKVGMSTSRNLSKVSGFFAVQDTESPADAVDEDADNFSEMLEHRPSYSVSPLRKYDQYSIDVGSDSYWQDYLPLSYFAQYVTNVFGEQYVDLDFIQVNLDYPVTPIFNGGSYDTSNAIVKTYVSFQLLEGGATRQLQTFSNVRKAPRDHVIEVASGEWLDTAYEIVDGTVIYPPTDVPITTLAIVTHIEMSTLQASAGTVALRKLQYASQAFNSDTANPVGTKFNIPVYPYQKFNSLFDYKSRNPYRIYKGSTPHMYLTKNTGLQKLGGYDQLINRGFLMQINDKQAESYRVIASQMFLYYGEDRFPAGNVKLFEIQSPVDYIKFYMQPVDSSRTRVKLYAQDAKTGKAKDGVAFYINGKIVKDAVISINEWTALGIRFAEPVSFDNGVGAIRVTGPMLVNNISYYESSSLQEVERQSYRLWDAVNSGGTAWQYWNDLVTDLGESYLWRDILVLASTKYSGISPTDIYNSYFGTNKIIGDDSSTFYIGGTSYETINGTSWSGITVKPL